MALDKGIEHGKEKRKPYRRSKAIDRTCRNHGSCEWCEKNRRHKFRDKMYTEQEIIEETQDYSQLSYELLQEIVEKGNRAWEEFVEDYNKYRIEELKAEIDKLEVILMKLSLDQQVPISIPTYNAMPVCGRGFYFFNGD